MNKSYEDVCQSLQKKGTEFATFLQELTVLNNDVLGKTERLLKAFDQMKGKNATCPICYTRTQTHVCQPCGHCTCENCSSRALSRNRCFTCRSPVQTIMRIYI